MGGASKTPKDYGFNNMVLATIRFGVYKHLVAIENQSISPTLEIYSTSKHGLSFFTVGAFPVKGIF